MEASIFNADNKQDATFVFLDTYRVKGDTVTVTYDDEMWAEAQGSTAMLQELVAHDNEMLKDDVENALAMEGIAAEVDDTRPGRVLDDHTVVLYLRPYDR